MLDKNKQTEILNCRNSIISFFIKKLGYNRYDDICDAYQHGVLEYIKSGIHEKEKDIFGTIIRHAWTHLNILYSDYYHYTHYIRDELPPRRRLDYNKLDPRFRNNLSNLQTKIWDMRCQYKSLKEITKKLCITKLNVMSTEYQMRRKYKNWYKTIYGLDAIPDFVFKNDYKSRAFDLYSLGYAPCDVASIIGITRIYAAQILYELRHDIIPRYTSLQFKK